MKNNILHDTTFSRKLNNHEKIIINNLYIAARYYGRVDESHQIEAFAHNLPMKLHRAFNPNINVAKHNLELIGVCVADLTNPDVRQDVEHKRFEVYLAVTQAIANNNLESLNRYLYYDININKLNSRGRLLVEIAAETASWDIVQCLIKSFNANPIRINRFGDTVITQACKLNKFEMIRGLLEMDETFVSYFLDDVNPEYNYANDPLRITLDLDQPLLLENLFRQLKGTKLLGVDTEVYDAMLKYALHNRKNANAHYLQTKLNKMQQLKSDLMQAIANDDSETVAVLIELDVNLNHEINGKYPLELACETRRWDILGVLLQTEGIKFSILSEVDDDGYNVRLDITKYVIESDEVAPFVMLLNLDDGEHLDNSHQALNLMYQYACEKSCNTIASFILEILQTANAKLFKATIENNIVDMIGALKNHANITVMLGGKSVLHVVSERSHIEGLHFLLEQPGIDVNCIDSFGNYPLTLACRQQNFTILEMLLNKEIVRRYAFQDSVESYEPELDVLKVIIDCDNVALLEPIMRRTQTNEELLHISRDNLLKLHNYASAHNKFQVANQLAQYIRILERRTTIFVDHGGELRNLGQLQQGISRVDTSFSISVMRLCGRYKATIEPVHGKGFSILRLSDDEDILQLVSSLQRMIANTKNIKYATYVDNPDAATNPHLPKLIPCYVTDKEYRGWATKTYNRLMDSLEKRDVMREWSSAWFDQTTKKLTPSIGITFGEVWCLAILAAQDRYAVAGIEYSAQDIQDREQILVAALVECTRAYSYSSGQYHDISQDARESCAHGVAVRALLALSGLHDDVHIHENPLEWSHNVAKDALHKFYNETTNKNELNDILIKYKFQRTLEETTIAAEFYENAKAFVEHELITVLGMQDNYGYLSTDDLKAILNDLESIDLPLARLSLTQVETVVAKAIDFTRLDVANFTNKTNVLVSQYKLPISADSGFAALIISAIANNVDLPENITVQKLRGIVTHIISCAINDVNELQENLAGIFKGCNVNPAQHRVIIVSIKQLIQNSRILEGDPGAERYLFAMMHYSQPDNLALMIISALWGVTISCYDFAGVPSAQISSTQIFLPSKNNVHIEYACKIEPDGTKLRQDRRLCCALVNDAVWPQLFPLLTELQIADAKQELERDHFVCESFGVMLGRNVAGLEQIKMPEDEHNLLISVLVAARHANISAAFDFSNVAHLKSIVESGVDPLYIGFESDKLEALARLFNARINVYDLATNSVEKFGVSMVELNLNKVISHYNLLVPPHSWLGFDARVLRTHTAVAQVVAADEEEEEELEQAASRVPRNKRTKLTH